MGIKNPFEYVDEQLTIVCRDFVIDIYKVDEYLHSIYGDYEKENKSMKDLIKEKYPDFYQDIETALTVFTD